MTSPTWVDDLTPSSVIWKGKLSSSSASLAVGDWFCIDPTDATGQTATKLSVAALAAAGAPLGIAKVATLPGGDVAGHMAGYVPPPFTGLGVGAIGAVRVNTTTARSERVSPSGSDYLVGIADTAGGITLDFELPGLGSATILNPANPADDGKMLYAAAGAWEKTATTFRTDGQALFFGAAPASGATINLSNNQFLRSITTGAVNMNVIGLSSANQVVVGSNTAGLVAVIQNLPTGGEARVSIAGNIEYRFFEGNADFTNNPLRFTTATGTGPSVSAITVRHGQATLGGRLNDDSAYASIITWGAATDRIDFGASNVAGMVFNISTGNIYRLLINSIDEFQFTATRMIVTSGNDIQFAGPGAAATTGRINFSLDNQLLMAVRDVGNTQDITLMHFGLGGVNRVDIGRSNVGTPISQMVFDIGTGGSFNWEINDSTMMILDVTSGLDLRARNLTWLFTHNTPTIQPTIDTTATEITSRVMLLAGQDKSGNTNTIAGSTRVRAGNATGAGGTHVGGNLFLEGGDASGGSGTRSGGSVEIKPGVGATADGTVYLMAGSTRVAEVAYIDRLRRVIALARGASITSTQMPTDTGDLVVYVGNAATKPTASAVGGFLLYGDGGAAKIRGTSGTITTIAPADPHCPRCKSDFVLEWENPLFADAVGDEDGNAGDGHFAACVPCALKGMGRALKAAHRALRAAGLDAKDVAFGREDWAVGRKAA